MLGGELPQTVHIMLARSIEDPRNTRTGSGNMLCLGCAGLSSADCCMPHRVRMFLEGLARQPGRLLDCQSPPANPGLSRILPFRIACLGFRGTLSTVHPASPDKIAGIRDQNVISRAQFREVRARR